MNDWMCPDLKWDDAYKPDRGKVLSAEELAGLDKFYRYVDRDDDAIPYRTLPGTSPKAAYFTRGSGHNQYGGYTEDSAEYQVVLDRLKRKFSNAPKYLPKPALLGKGNSEVGIVSVGSCDGAIREALDVLGRQKIEVDYLRVKAFPFNSDVESFLKSHATIFVVEQNRDAQLKSLLTLETAVEKSKLFSILSYSGLPMSAEPVVNGIRAKLEEAPRLTAVSRKT
jgi:2-oxoglutarate ferredoxin oxidoreductase subunit alpha